MKQGLFLVVMVLTLVGCTKSVEQQLVAEGGTWKGDGFGIATKLTFYKDGDVTLKESSRTYSGTYHYNEQENKLTLDFPTIGKQILTNVTLEKGTLRATYGKNEVSFEPEKNE